MTEVKGCRHRSGRFQERTTGHLEQVVGNGNAKEGTHPRVIVEAEFTGQDDWMCGLWQGEAGEFIPRFQAEVLGVPFMEKGNHPLFP